MCSVLAGVAWGQASSLPSRSFGLHADSPRFWEVVHKGTGLEKIAGGFGFTEGPVWDQRGFLYVSDETKDELLRLFPDGRKELILHMGDPDGSTLDRHHRLITCASVLRAIVAIEPDGRYRVLADKYQGKRFNSPNDVVLGPDGALYFTDPTLDLPKGEKQELSFQGVYRLGKDGSIRLLTADLEQPNGLAFSPDGRRLYVDDSKRRDIRVFDVGPAMKLQQGKVFGAEPGPPHSGVPDGIKVDRKGHVLVTGPGGIWVWDAEGNHLGTIHLPEQPANLAWGDADYRSLFITAETSVYRIKTGTSGFVPFVTN